MQSVVIFYYLAIGLKRSKESGCNIHTKPVVICVVESRIAHVICIAWYIHMDSNPRAMQAEHWPVRAWALIASRVNPLTLWA